MAIHDRIDQLTAHLFRENSGKMAAVLSRTLGLNQIDLVMDIVQDTFETALTKWRFSGIPDNPSGWLMQVAKNKAINLVKRENKTRSYSPSVYLNKFDTQFDYEFESLLSPDEIKDSQLRLLYTCCHPDLSTKNQIIITLYILCGFGVPEIANALLMNEEAVKKTLTRSKDKLKELNHILQTRLVTQSEKRQQTVLLIIYLVFNEGYKTTRSKDAINNDLCFEAIRLAKLVEDQHTLSNGETEALLSLMFFNLSRFGARLNTNHELLTLEEQDRSEWNTIFIEEGYYYLNKATQSETVTRFHIEAIISSLHCSAQTFSETNWKQITSLYRQLEQIEPLLPLVTLNRIIAESYIINAVESIHALNELEQTGILKNNFLLPATKGDVYKRNGAFHQARVAYEEALNLSVSPVDKVFFTKKIRQCKQHTT